MKRIHTGQLLLHALLVGSLLTGVVGCCDDSDNTDPTDTSVVDTVADTSSGGDTGEEGDTTADTAAPAFVLHYHRPDGDYEGWTATATGDVDGGPTLTAGEPDGFGATFELPLADGATTVTISFDNADSDQPVVTYTVDVSAAEGIWHFAGGEAPLTTAPPAIPGEDQLAVYYLRDDGEYSGWGLHCWEDVANTFVWTQPQPAGGVDETLGAWYLVDLVPDAETVGLIVHKGDEKDPGPDMMIDLTQTGDMVFLITGSTEIFTVPTPIPDFSIKGAAAHWVTQDTILWTPSKEGATAYELRYDADAEIGVAEADVVGGEVLTLTASELPLADDVAKAFPHIKTRTPLALAATDLAKVPEILEGEIVVVARDDSGAPVDATRVQIPGVLDDLFAYDGPLGVTWDGGAPTFHLWAPTAQAVELVRYAAADKSEVARVALTKVDGVWTYDGADASWAGDYYRYALTVFHPTTLKVETLEATDPYSVSLSTGSEYSHLADLGDAALKPTGWDTFDKPALEAPEDIVIYEGHVRDFSAMDETVPEAHRGKFLAFTDVDADGMNHLESLAAAGLTHLHLLPFFDIASVGEFADSQVDLEDGFDRLCALNASVPTEDCDAHGTTPIGEVLAGLDPTTEAAQEIATWMGGLDEYNWGYDPLHYTVPEGSYATDPEGSARVLELREAVKSLNEAGLRVVMDVVYNHTNAAGTGTNSVLDKVVPGYYHRLDPDTGLVLTSTCCPNTATEHAMMERLMIDSLVTWARDYKIDGFRFDLMGHHLVRNMEAVQAALAALTMEDDGVDGSKIYVYGEGWDFGEVANNGRGVNAAQLNLAGTGIGSFNDRLRDAVRGGSAFDEGVEIREAQGFGNGQYVQPNERVTPDEDLLEDVGVAADLIRVSLTGGLKTFVHTNYKGATKTGYLTPYNGDHAGYTDDPQEIVNYVCAHDNQTLFDNNAYKAPTGTTMADRVRMQNVSLDTVLFGQGVPFVHMGAELLRSKSMERDSYNSGDWFNRVFWDRSDNNWNAGLPNAEKDQANWSLIGQIIGDAAISPMTADIDAAYDHFVEALQIRKSSPLFRLRDAESVKTRVDFYLTGDDSTPGVLAMTLSDATCAGDDLDASYDAVVVVFNATPDSQDVAIADATGFELHPVLSGGSDETVKTSTFDEGTDTFSVPAWTTAVFVAPQGDARADVIPCNRNYVTE